VKSPLNYVIAALMPLVAIAQSPEFSVYGGLPMFIRDNASPFGPWGAQEGGLDGLNLSAGGELQLPLWNDWSMHAGLDLYSIRAVGSTSTAQLSGASPRIGLGYAYLLDNLLMQARGSLGLASIRTTQTQGGLTTLFNGGWGTLAAPASLGLRVSMPYASGRLYAELSYRYFMFNDGIDGMGGGGTRIGNHDDQMLIGVAGYTWNLQNFQSRDQRELVQAKKAAQSLPLLKKASEELKIAQAELMDELEVVKIQKLKLEQRLDSMDQGLKAPSTAHIQSQMAGGSASASTEIRYVVVVGSFRSDRLAAQYVSRLKATGVNCSITEGSNGFVRVYTGPFTNESAALNALAKVRGETPGAWLLRL
jgi:hypothetical protein